jgi:hypothetical protein
LQVRIASVCSLQLQVCVSVGRILTVSLHYITLFFFFGTTLPHSLVMTAVVAMYVEASVIAYVAFAFPLVTGPLTIQQHYKLWKMSSTWWYAASWTCELITCVMVVHAFIVFMH